MTTVHSVAGSLPYLTPVQRGTIGCNSLPFVCPYVHPSEWLVPVQAVRVSLNPRPCNTSIMPGVQPSLPTCSSLVDVQRARDISSLRSSSSFLVSSLPRVSFMPHLNSVRIIFRLFPRPSLFFRFLFSGFGGTRFEGILCFMHRGWNILAFHIDSSNWGCAWYVIESDYDNLYYNLCSLIFILICIHVCLLIMYRI